MAEAAGATTTTGAPEVKRRDMLTLLTASTVAIGVGALAWPLVDSMNPASDVLALASIEVDLTPIQMGQAITVVWRGKPVFVRNRTPEEVQEAEHPKGSEISPQPDSERVKAGHAEWLVVVGICTHLGCVPLGNKPTEARGDWGGWFCPCHGSAYDTSGRVRKGPAPANLAVPPYTFVSDTRIRIG